MDAISKRLSEKKDLKVTILIDFFRGTRMDGNGLSSLGLLNQLSAQYGKRISICFYHSPNVNNLLKSIVPPRFIEGFGLQHMKLYISDSHLIISGANLSKVKQVELLAYY